MPFNRIARITATNHHYTAGTKIALAVKDGIHIDSQKVKSVFSDCTPYDKFGAQHYHQLAQLTNGIAQTEPNSNMSYYEALGFAIQGIKVRDMEDHDSFSIKILNIANDENFINHPFNNNGLDDTEALYLAGFVSGFYDSIQQSVAS